MHAPFGATFCNSERSAGLRPGRRSLLDDSQVTFYDRMVLKLANQMTARSFSTCQRYDTRCVFIQAMQQTRTRKQTIFFPLLFNAFLPQHGLYMWRGTWPPRLILRLRKPPISTTEMPKR